MLCQLSVETAYKFLRSAILINDCLPSRDDSRTKFHSGDFLTKVNHNVVIHLSCFDPFAIFTVYKPIIVGNKAISVTQKLYAPLFRANEEVDPALRGSAFRESSHHAFRIFAACTIKFLLNCASGIDRGVLLLPLRSPLVFRFFGLKSLRTSITNPWRLEALKGASLKQEPFYISFMQWRCESILDLFFNMTFVEQLSSFETLAKWIAGILILRLSYYHEALRFFEHLE